MKSYGRLGPSRLLLEDAFPVLRFALTACASPDRLRIKHELARGSAVVMVIRVTLRRHL